jgi:hypothetical protein
MTQPQLISDQVRAYATAIGAIIGADPATTETRVGPAPCETSGSEVTGNAYYIQGNWQMPLPPADHSGALARLRDSWVEQGYEIKRFHMFSDTEGLVIAENPVDKFELMAESAAPPTAVAVVIMSPCYRSAT